MTWRCAKCGKPVGEAQLDRGQGLCSECMGEPQPDIVALLERNNELLSVLVEGMGVVLCCASKWASGGPPVLSEDRLVAMCGGVVDRARKVVEGGS